MLTIKLGGEQSIETEIFGARDIEGERIVLLCDGMPIGIAVFTVKDNAAVLLRIGILPEYRGKRYGDFFTRSVLYKLSAGGLNLAVNCADEYYLRFGFEACADGTMRVANEKLSFPSDCGCH